MSNELIQIFHIAIAINKYNVDQTGAKTQLGGLKLGSIISEYQGSLKVVVVKPPIAEAKKVIKSITNIIKINFHIYILHSCV